MSGSKGPFGGGGDERLEALQGMESLSETLRDRPAGALFSADLQEAQTMATHDPRFESLVRGLEASTLGERLAAINAFFDQIPAIELTALTLPPHLSQLRFIYLSSRS